MRTILNIDVPELERAIAFYEAALGLKLVRLLDGDFAELAGVDCMVCLLKKAPGTKAAASAGERGYDHRHWTPVHVDFIVDDLEKAAERALAAGAQQESGIVEWRGSRCITFGDPFGHGFCLIEFDGDTYQ